MHGQLAGLVYRLALSINTLVARTLKSQKHIQDNVIKRISKKYLKMFLWVNKKF